MSEEMQLPTEADLAKLSHRAMVAYAARCARRVQPLLSAVTDESLAAMVALAERAISWAESFAAATEMLHIFRPDELSALLSATNAAARDAAAQAASPKAAPTKAAARFAARFAASVAHVAQAADAAAKATVAADVASPARAAKSAVTAYAAHAAAYAADDDEDDQDDRVDSSNAAAIATMEMVKSCVHDYQLLLQFSSHAGGGVGNPIDFDRLGPLWPEGELRWARTVHVEPVEATWGVGTPNVVNTPDVRIEIYIDPGNASKETIQEVLECLSDMHIAAGGFGLEFVADDLEIHAMEGIPS